MESAPALPTPNEPMSKRTPTTTASKNMADCIERSLLHGNHRIWGYTIYRCTYASDSDWDELLRRLRSKLEEGLRSFNGTDLMSSFDMKVFEDKTLFNEASAATIREHFTKWAGKASWTEQGEPPYRSPRYKFCIQVGLDELRSVLDDHGDGEKRGFVRLVKKDWSPRPDAYAQNPNSRPAEGFIKPSYNNVQLATYARFRYSDSIGWHQ